jgi:uncharacterized iron-regulated protein
MAPAAVLGLALLLVVGAPSAHAQAAPAADSSSTPLEIVEGRDYRVYDREGSPTSIAAIVRASLGEEVLLVGEEHDDMVGHALEVLLFETVLEEIGGPARSGRTVVLSMEMFERDVQYVVDEYLSGLISEENFLRSVRPWPYYEARYRPLVEAARSAGVSLVAANAPRRYVSRVSAEGPHALEALSPHARTYLPPLPYPGPSPRYRAQWDSLLVQGMQGGEAEGDTAESGGAERGGAERAGVESEEENDRPSAVGQAAVEGEVGPASDISPARPYAMSPNVIQAQALWDAAMGHAITDALVRNAGGFVMHVAGSFHVEKGTGIPERIADYRPGTRLVSIVMTKVDDVDAWSAEDHGPLADYVVLTKRPD